ncbi:MAG: AI-2E family transporter [Peptococcaceae bacterium]
MEKKMFRSYLLLITFAVSLVLVITKIDLLVGALGIVLRLLSPFFIGFAIAFVLNIPYEAIRRALGKYEGNRVMKRLRKPLSIVGAYLLSFGIFGGVIAVVIPELAHSINMLIDNSETYQQNFQMAVAWLNQFNLPHLQDLDAAGILASVQQELTALTKQVVDALSTVFPQLFRMTTNIVQGVANVGIGLIVSVYLLFSKETMCQQVKRMTYAFLPKRWADECVEISRLINQCFTNFVSGQLVEACILGTLCFIGMGLFHFEYAFLISLLIGVSAIVPIVGAFIGTVPAVFLLFLVEPMQAVWFIVFIVILQQIEGHLIYPKVVGESVGLPPLWVLMGIVVGGGLGGILGMLLGVPIFTVIYKLLSQTVQQRLERKKNSAVKL